MGNKVAGPKGPGRPSRSDSEPEVKQVLLMTALRLGARSGIADVSTRSVAEAAGVTPAMVHYYFGSKQGLFEAVLDEIVARMLPRIREVAAQDFSSDAGLNEFVRSVALILIEEPAIPGFMIKEVILGDGHLRGRFIETYAEEVVALVPLRIIHEIETGNLRRDLDPMLCLLSLIGMTIFPFVARPVAEEAFAIRFEDGFAEKFAHHTTQLFLHGAQPLKEASA